MNNSHSSPITYQQAGVDISTGNAFIEHIKPIAERTRRPGVLAGLGGFGGLYELPMHTFKHPILVSSTDGVGTKLKLAQAMNQYDTIGIDLVAMCVNDVIVQGAEPLFFLDYLATGHLTLEIATKIMEGIGKGCEEAGVALIGGETAEMPGVYSGEDFDLAGFTVGIVEKDNLIEGRAVRPKDLLIALPSSGVHSNGFSLIRHLLTLHAIDLHVPFGDTTLGHTLLSPTRIYVKPILHVLRHLNIHALSHITGGGLIENIPRVLPPFTQARIDQTSWQIPPIFQWIQELGNLSQTEMYTTFNCGIGMVLCVAPEEAPQTLKRLKEAGEVAWIVGEIEASASEKAPVVFS